ncbi:MAG: PKD domain-containing protein [Gammaproteobacteria bacterium]|nr:PKD domain-containing protein [Gammaproteobacteria bacterium]
MRRARVTRAALIPITWIVAVAGALLLSACGGGSSSSLPPAAPANRAPVADAGNDIMQVIQSSPVALDATGSSDPDADTLTYRWEVSSQPESSAIELDDPASAQPSFAAALTGEYVFELEVSDPDGLSSTDTVTVTLTNEPPVVDVASVDRIALVGADVTLDAQGSSDPDGHELSFTWRIVELPADSGMQTVYDGPVQTIRFDSQGTYVFELEVDDGYEPALLTLESFDVTVYAVIALDVSIIDAEFDPVGERIVALTEEELLTIDSNENRAAVELPAAGKAVSVSPDGAYAAVGHDGWVSHVDLNEMRLLETHSLATSLGEVVIDEYGYAHGFPDTGQWVSIYSVDLVSGAVRLGVQDFVRHQMRARLHPSGAKIYGANTDLSPSDLERYSIVAGAIDGNYDSPYHGDHEFCGNVWFDPDGELILSPCGVVVRATDDRATDMLFAMRLEGFSATDRIRDAASSNADGGLWYVVAERDGWAPDHVQTYDIEFGRRAERFNLPLVDAAGERRWFADFVFASASSQAHYVIATDDSGDSKRQALLVRQSP